MNTRPTFHTEHLQIENPTDEGNSSESLKRVDNGSTWFAYISVWCSSEFDPKQTYRIIP